MLSNCWYLSSTFCSELVCCLSSSRFRSLCSIPDCNSCVPRDRLLVSCFVLCSSLSFGARFSSRPVLASRTSWPWPSWVPTAGSPVCSSMAWSRNCSSSSARLLCFSSNRSMHDLRSSNSQSLHSMKSLSSSTSILPCTSMLSCFLASCDGLQVRDPPHSGY